MNNDWQIFLKSVIEFVGTVCGCIVLIIITLDFVKFLLTI